MDQKGFEAAQAALEMANLLRRRSMTTTEQPAPRRRAREFVLQGLYQRQLSGNAARGDPRATSPRARASARPTSRTSTSCGAA